MAIQNPAELVGRQRGKHSRMDPSPDMKFTSTAVGGDDVTSRMHEQAMENTNIWNSFTICIVTEKEDQRVSSHCCHKWPQAVAAGRHPSLSLLSLILSVNIYHETSTVLK